VDNGQDNEGGAWVYLAPPWVCQTPHGWRQDSDQGGANYGFAGRHRAGDVNGDGCSDIIVGRRSGMGVWIVREGGSRITARVPVCT